MPENRLMKPYDIDRIIAKVGEAAANSFPLFLLDMTGSTHISIFII
jgi:hypothetical protein